MDVNGAIVDSPKFEEMLVQHKPTLFYTIPTYHNPTGVCLSIERRRKLIELSKKYNFLIVADEVYQLLNFETLPPPTPMFALETSLYPSASDSTVISIGSFSKILGPGLRLGWIETKGKLLQHLMSFGVVHRNYQSIVNII